jgi:hypothetical protein
MDVTQPAVSQVNEPEAEIKNLSGLLHKHVQEAIENVELVLGSLMPPEQAKPASVPTTVQAPATPATPSSTSVTSPVAPTPTPTPTN